MKKRIFTFIGVLLMSNSLTAQQIPTNTSPAGAGPSGSSNNQFWSRAGNSGGGANAQNNILWEKEILGNKDRKEFACSLNFSYIQRT